MSQNTVQIFDDNVLKITIKQGSETERFNIDFNNIKAGGKVNYGDNETIDILDPESISSVPGSFSSGELAYTRDTGRVFVGSLTNTRESNQQVTFGGSLVGNKYLGFVDSKRDFRREYGDNKSNGAPLNLGESTGTEPGLLTSNSLYRSYNFPNSDSNAPQATSDRKWPRLSFYNETYDAYDGDYMYDIYRNALILFDHNIKPSKRANETNFRDNEPTANRSTLQGKRKTPLIPRQLASGNSTTALSTVTQHTEDMYGDGYVLFYNVIPDGETLTFVDRSFSEEDGSCNSSNDTLTNNFSYNVIRLNKVPVSALSSVFDPDQFLMPTDSGGKIKLQPGVISGGGGGGITVTGGTENGIVVLRNNKLVTTNVTISSSAAVELDKLGALRDWPTDADKTVYSHIYSNEYLNTIAAKVKDIIIASGGSIGGGSGSGGSNPQMTNADVIIKYNQFRDDLVDAAADIDKIIAIVNAAHPTGTPGAIAFKEYFPEGKSAVSTMTAPATLDATASEQTIKDTLDDAYDYLNGNVILYDDPDDDPDLGPQEETEKGIFEDIENLISFLRKVHPELKSDIDKAFPNRGLENLE